MSSGLEAKLENGIVYVGPDVQDRIFSERISRIYQMHADKQNAIDFIEAGDIGAAVGFKDIKTGDTLSSEKAPIILESMVFPDPVIGVAVEPKTKADVDKLGENFATKEELIEFTNDGLNIIDFFLRHRQEHFQKHGWKLLGIEMPILIPPHEDYPNVKLMGKLDLVMFDETLHKVVIWDIKTSTRGWGKYDKNNKIKTSQMVMYKKYFSEQYNVPVDNIDVRYFIVKRKVPDNPKYAIMKSRIQKFEPSSGKTTQNKMVKNMKSFIEDVFIDGTHMYDTDNIDRILAETDKCSSKWCQTCNK